MTLRDWVGARLHHDEHGRSTGVVDVSVQGPHSIKATRDDLPAAFIYCAEASTAPLEPADIDAALEEMPDVQYVVVTRRRIDNST